VGGFRPRAAAETTWRSCAWIASMADDFSGNSPSTSHAHQVYSDLAICPQIGSNEQVEYRRARLRSMDWSHLKRVDREVRNVRYDIALQTPPSGRNSAILADVRLLSGEARASRPDIHRRQCRHITV